MSNPTAGPRPGEANVTREPLTHLMAFLMKSEELGSDGGKLPRLVFSKFDEIMDGFQRILDASCPNWRLLHTLLDGESEDMISSKVAILVSLTLQSASEVHRRIGGVVNSFPAKLAWMIYTTDPNQPCEKRKKVSADLLRSPSQNLDASFTQKFRDLLKDDLGRCSSTGCLEPMLHQLLFESFSLLVMDTQEVEGCNSIIKKVVQIAPSIKLPLLSDRLMIKKTLTPRVLKGATASLRREARLETLQYCADYHQASLLQSFPYNLTTFLF